MTATVDKQAPEKPALLLLFDSLPTLEPHSMRIPSMRFALLCSLILLSGCEYLTSAERSDEMMLPPPTEEGWAMDDGQGEAAPLPTVNAVEDEQTVATPAPVLSDERKIEILREEVARIQGEVDALKPDIQKVDLIQRQLDLISKELASIDGRHGLKEKPKAKPQPKKASPKPSVPQQSMKITSGTKEVGRVRFGKAGNATRVVLDLGASAKYSTDLDNEEKILIIELPGTKYAAKSEGNGMGLVQSYTGKTSENGTAQVILQLSSPVKIKASQALPPNGSYGHRVYLDLTSL